MCGTLGISSLSVVKTIMSVMEDTTSLLHGDLEATMSLLSGPLVSVFFNIKIGGVPRVSS